MRNCYLYCGESGFNNRFNVLLSGLTLAKKTKTNPIIIWQETNQCGATFADIFETNHQVYVDYDCNLFFDNHDTLNIVHENQTIGKDIQFTNTFAFNKIDEIINHVNLSHKDIFFYTHIRPSWVNDSFLISDIIPELKFKEELINICDQTIKENVNGGNFFGLHIRKTDFPNYNPNLESELSTLISQNKQNTYFVCSDSKETEDLFERFDNVFTYKKNNYTQKLISSLDWMDTVEHNTGRRWPYNVNRTKQNILEAMVDMMILSKSTIIETVIHSTFLQNSILLNSYWKSTNQLRN